ncbi:MAG: Gfo/Idh/MocA family oxidoreductase [Pirellulaceae bacterium]|nr:Gfo/Idh/MocA family oxidoreductase [Planctomycetales bacterium]
MNLTPEEREIGRENYYDALGYSYTRRDFLKGALAAAGVSGAGLGAMYFGYEPKLTDPVRIGVIGTGDEGNILIGALNPDFVQVIGIADIRPSSIHRAFHGDWGGGDPYFTHTLRPGLMQVYGWKTEDEAKSHVTVYDDYNELLKNPDIEAVIIALPLHLHAPAAIAAMQAGKHVLTEKLMAHNVAQCKLMGRVSAEKNLLLATGHQRHYSVLYDNAVNMIRWGLIGQIHHIRAQWHRGNLPGSDSWSPPLPGGEMTLDRNGKEVHLDRIAKELDRWQKEMEGDKAKKDKKYAQLMADKVAQWTQWDADKHVAAAKFGYEELSLPNGRTRTALEELIRWRLWNRTGGGLMAELGSHQLDAASIFVSALRKDGKKAHPLTVHAVGGRHVFPLDRDAEDHVYCMFEFPGPAYDEQETARSGYYDAVSAYYDQKDGKPPLTIPNYSEDPNKKIVVTYSSINGNGFGGYGEIVMGTAGTIVLEKEQEVMLYSKASTSTSVGVTENKGGAAVLDTQASGGPRAAVAKAVEASGPVSRGYREEIEHWAWCIRNRDAENQIRCNPKVALGDAVIALTTKVAIDKANSGEGGFIKFDENWYDVDHDATPDGSSVEEEKSRLKA